MQSVQFRRSRHVVSYWEESSYVVHNYATRERLVGTAFLGRILDVCDEWTSLAAIVERCAEMNPEHVKGLVDRLARLRILHRSDKRPPHDEDVMSALDSWNPVAGFFHTATKQITYAERIAAERAVRERTGSRSAPLPVKRYPRLKTVRLPQVAAHGEFPDVLRARRTWRRFSTRPVTVAQLGGLLGLTGGFQQFVRTGTADRTPQRTSPSGGARQPVELYVFALNVRGLPKGLYHYSSDIHVLQRIRAGVHPGRVQRYLPTQYWFEGAAAIVFFAGIFKRTSWRYHNPRAYRAVLIEAGHLCQTFCLTATWLGLAPFCSMAIADREIEKDLRLDGISESVLYAAGVGCRAAAASESFSPDDVPPPRIEANPAFGAGRAVARRTRRSQ
jgi:SagB-type dehydrogenase family enzyme